MTHDQTQQMISNLSEILDSEREALLAGDLDRLGDLLSPKEELIEAMATLARPDPSTLKDLDQKVRRNQLLLDGALEGIRAVAARMAKLQEVRGALETYGADGKKRDIPVRPETSVEHRA